jgi:hypothetical protein
VRSGPVATLVAAAAAIVAPCLAEAVVQVQVTSVRAYERGPSDAQLIQLRPRLRRLVGYRSFRIVGQERRDCAWGTREAFTIPGGRLLHVVPKGMREQAVLMQVQLMDGRRALVDTDVRLQNRGVMLFGVDKDAPPEGGALIIMLRAEE